MSPLRSEHAAATDEFRGVAWRLIAVLALALSLVWLARVALGPSLS